MNNIILEYFNYDFHWIKINLKKKTSNFNSKTFYKNISFVNIIIMTWKAKYNFHYILAMIFFFAEFHISL